MFVANSFPRKRTFPYVDERLLANQGFESPYLQSTLAAVAERVDCRAGALAKADPLAPCERERSEPRLGRPVSPLLRSQR